MSAPLKAAAEVAAGAAREFVPRTVFQVSDSITRSYYLGHHRAALSSMEKTLSNIGLVLECRDSRIPLTSTNPLLESTLAGRDRIIVYTKSNYCAPTRSRSNRTLDARVTLLKRYHNNYLNSSSPSSSTSEEMTGGAEGRGKTDVVFTDERNERSVVKLLNKIKKRAAEHDSLLGLRALVVGMPNAGKSTLLNALRRAGMKRSKAAKTGAEPGVTRKLSTPVRIAPGTSTTDNNNTSSLGPDFGEGIFVVDTPGVFVPYVSDVASMLKLALVGCVKDGVVPVETVVDYLLFRLNLVDPLLYGHLCTHPTNDVNDFLHTLAMRHGMLKKGGVPNILEAANYVLHQWRVGNLGAFCLDDISEQALREHARELAEGGEQRVSMSQARKREKLARKEKNLAKRAAALGTGSN